MIRRSESLNSEESVVFSSIQQYPSGGQHSECNTTYFSWPTSNQLHGSVEGRATYFGNLQKGILPSNNRNRLTNDRRATSLLDLMTIRAFHSKMLRRFSLGTAIGFRIRLGNMTDIPAILVFVPRKLHREWLDGNQCLPAMLEGPGGVWCDVDVLEFSYYGAPAPTPKEQLCSELVDGLRGSDPCIGSGSQVANQETHGTLGAIVKSRTGNGQVGFLTNRHVAVDLDYPNQKMFHPLPPNHGPGVYLGAVERATSFTTDDLWYGIYAGMCPETYVRADGAFIPFVQDFDMSTVSTLVKGVGEIGEVKIIDLQSPINSIIGKQVVKVGRSSGLTTGTITAYALMYNDENGNCFLTDFLVVGENQQTFDLEGDSGSLILLSGEEEGEKPRPIGIIWGGTANRGRLKVKAGQSPENWTSGVDLGRLLDLLELDVITTMEGLQEAVTRQRTTTSTMEESCPTVAPTNTAEERNKCMFEPLGINIQQVPIEGTSASGVDLEHTDINRESNMEEHQFIPSFVSPIDLNQEDTSHELRRNLSTLKNSSDEDEGMYVSLELGDRGSKRQRSGSALKIESPK